MEVNSLNFCLLERRLIYYQTFCQFFSSSIQLYLLAHRQIVAFGTYQAIFEFVPLDPSHRGKNALFIIILDINTQKSYVFLCSCKEKM